jgi:predicted permease
MSKSNNPPGPRPPRLAELLVSWVATRDARDVILGDLAERYAQLAQVGVRRANHWYWHQALRCLNPLHRFAVQPRRTPRAAFQPRALFGGVLQDLRYGARGLTRRVGFTITAVVTLGIGIGATTAIFSIVNGVLLRPLPYPESDRLVNVWQVNTAWFDSPNLSLRSWADEFPASMPTFNDWEELNQVFLNIGAYDDRTVTLSDGDRPERVYSTRVSSGVWRALGVPPLLGRTFVAADDKLGVMPLAVLSYGFWQRRFGGDRSILGTTIRLGETPHRVVGVMPEAFNFPTTGHDLWTTFDDESKASERSEQYLTAIARLKPGITLAGAQREMELLTERMVESRDHNPDFGIRLVPRIEQMVGDVQLILLVLLGAVGLVLLISCANIANMLLARATERRRELAIRSALGARRGRLLRQLLSESMVLAIAGGAAGVLIALVSFQPLTAALPSRLPRVDEVALDHRVLLFAAATSILTGLLVGSLPAFRAARSDVAETLQDGGRGFTGSRRRNLTQGALVISEITLAFVLLVGAGLLVKSFVQLTSVERGFNAERVLVFDFRLPTEAMSQPARAASPRPASTLSENQLRYVEYVGTLLERLEAVPGAQLVAAADNVPFMRGTSSGTTTVENGGGIEETNVERSAVSPEYFSALGVPLVSGRSFVREDGPESEFVAIVSRGMAERYWPGEDPVGRRLKRGQQDSENPWLTIVGVAEEVRHQGLDIDPRPKMYMPYAQSPRGNIDVIIKTRVAPEAIVALTLEALAEFDPTVPPPNVQQLEQVVSSSVAAPRFRTRLVSLLAALAALLAVIGVYGVLSYTTTQRTGEIGVRMALGASTTDVVKSVLVRSAALAGTGLALGVVIALAAVRLLDNFLYQTSIHDPMMFVTAAILLTAAALAASYLPARRATKVDPVDALRAD